MHQQRDARDHAEALVLRGRVVQLKVEDVAEADDIFTKLMGDVVEPRRDFIRANALMVENLDT